MCYIKNVELHAFAKHCIQTFNHTEFLRNVPVRSSNVLRSFVPVLHVWSMMKLYPGSHATEQFPLLMSHCVRLWHCPHNSLHAFPYVLFVHASVTRYINRHIKQNYVKNSTAKLYLLNSISHCWRI